MSIVTRVIRRRRFELGGVVQGVGFRPFVHRLASHYGLSGFVRNAPGGVTIEVQGEIDKITAFAGELQREPPPLARIERLASLDIPPDYTALDHSSFMILASARASTPAPAPMPAPGAGPRNPEAVSPGAALPAPDAATAPRQTAGISPGDGLLPSTEVSPDAAPCDACRADYLDPANRRFGYAFTNCTHCGPRYTIIRALPYDRECTTMAVYRQCPACEREYGDPGDRRFHAQPNACPACGPQLELARAGGGAERPPGRAPDSGFWRGSQALRETRRQLRLGAIVAIKNVGGYQLACDAANPAAVERLRRAKRRPAKPFALLAPSVDAIAEVCAVSPAESRSLRSRARPIVLLERRAGRPGPRLEAGAAPNPGSPCLAVAPGQARLGCMLPSSPLQDLLLAGPGALPWLVMTSGNRGSLPMARDAREARAQLDGIADFFLDHGREVYMTADDSVGAVIGEQFRLFRRARGYVPAALATGPAAAVAAGAGASPAPAVWVWAAGAELKTTFCLARGSRAWLSPHLGDLGNLETWERYERTLEHDCRLHRAAPGVLAYDPHPGYLVSRRSREWATARGITRQIPVQHHHAHIVSCMAEHRLGGQVLGVAFDGTGYGPGFDGEPAIWGGEWLIAGRAGFTRAGCLRPLPLLGGDRAARQPWRMALSYLLDTLGAEAAGRRAASLWPGLKPARWRPALALLAHAADHPDAPAGAAVACTSAGRLFDAVAALLGVAPEEMSFEGEAALALEDLAASAPASASPLLPYRWTGAEEEGVPAQLDLRPLIAALLAARDRGAAPAPLARSFHATLAEAVAEGCERVRGQPPLSSRQLGDALSGAGIRCRQAKHATKRPLLLGSPARERAGASAGATPEKVASHRVCLSGGSFQNRLLLRGCSERLQARGFTVYTHAVIPPNDGGLALGQAVAAQARLAMRASGPDAAGGGEAVLFSEAQACV